MTLREMLHKDFGIDLPIAGGWGQSADDPIVLTSQDPDEPALVRFHKEFTINTAIDKKYKTQGSSYD
jgi:hypothetical protein